MMRTTRWGKWRSWRLHPACHPSIPPRQSLVCTQALPAQGCHRAGCSILRATTEHHSFVPPQSTIHLCHHRAPRSTTLFSRGAANISALHCTIQLWANSGVWACVISLPSCPMLCPLCHRQSIVAQEGMVL